MFEAICKKPACKNWAVKNGVKVKISEKLIALEIKEYLRTKKRSLPVNIVKGIVFRLTGKYC